MNSQPSTNGSTPKAAETSAPAQPSTALSAVRGTSHAPAKVRPMRRASKRFNVRAAYSNGFSL